MGREINVSSRDIEPPSLQAYRLLLTHATQFLHLVTNGSPMVSLLKSVSGGVMSLADRLRMVRGTLQLSTRGMSLKLGMSPSLWTQYENAHKEPGLDTLRALYSLGVSIDWLLSGKGQPWWTEAGHALSPNGIAACSGNAARSKALLHGLGEDAGPRLTIWREIVQRLRPAGAQCTFEELLAPLSVGVTEAELQYELKLLQQENMISLSRGRYQLVRLYKSTTSMELELRFLLLLHDLMHRFFPGFRARPVDGTMIDGRVLVGRGQGRERLRELRNRIEEWRKSCGTVTEPDDSEAIDLSLVMLANGEKHETPD